MFSRLKADQVVDFCLKLIQNNHNFPLTGTGKTRVIVNVIGEIFKNCERKPKVLVCSVSNACINEITYALLQKRSGEI